MLEIENKNQPIDENLSDNGYKCYNNDTMSSKKTAGKLFKRVRQEKGLTQAQLAKKADIHPNTYAKIERDEQEASFSTVKKIAKILDLNLSDIPD